MKPFTWALLAAGAVGLLWNPANAVLTVVAEDLGATPTAGQFLAGFAPFVAGAVVITSAYFFGPRTATLYAAGGAVAGAIIGQTVISATSSP